MPKYTIDLDALSIRFLDAGGFRDGGNSEKQMPADLKATVFNLITAVATDDLMIVQCFEHNSEVPVFLLCAFLDHQKYGGRDRLIPLCELTHPADLLECVRPPSSVPQSVFVVPHVDENAGDYSPLVDEQQPQHAEDHYKYTKH